MSYFHVYFSPSSRPRPGRPKVFFLCFFCVFFLGGGATGGNLDNRALSLLKIPGSAPARGHLYLNVLLVFGWKWSIYKSKLEQQEYALIYGDDLKLFLQYAVQCQTCKVLI